MVLEFETNSDYCNYENKKSSYFSFHLENKHSFKAMLKQGRIIYKLVYYLSYSTHFGCNYK